MERRGIMARRSISRASTDLVSDHLVKRDDRLAIRSLLWTLKPLVDLRKKSIPLPFVTTFLMVALDEGRGVNEYARAVGLHRWYMSRYLYNIGHRSRSGGPRPRVGRPSSSPHPEQKKTSLSDA
jgi:hypothetical protein